MKGGKFMITFRQKQHHVRYAVTIIYKNDFVKVIHVTDDYWKACSIADEVKNQTYKDKNIIDVCVYERI